MTSTKPTFTLFSTTGLSIMLILGLMLGFAAGVVVPRAFASSSTPGDASAEAGFARDMSDHHAQAVHMAMLAHQRAANGTLRVIAGDIAVTQQGQVGMMQQWLREWGLNTNRTGSPMAWMPDGEQSLQDGLMPGMATPAELTQLESATGPDFDRLFLKLMIKHHLGGIHMVDGVLKQSTNPDIVWLAGSMKSGQQGEITVMQQLQQSIG
ncbi:DUF305 domain-containing protein [Allorhizocola rhizosphaerae]|uniref:DUF305 domain-containing protein n=1 Tax=Allorhizocola rhizosphaerae TaxID=1872709 RepID=UPI000E3BFA56|nr:DUF305 domain-containing protein [Allorhizocola rhizosphaerae]